MRILLKLICAAGAVVALSGMPVALAAGVPAAVPVVSAGAPQPADMILQTGTGKVLTLTGSAANIFVANPKVAEVRPASANTLFMFGVGPGKTTVAIMDSTGHVLAQYNVTVIPESYNADAAQRMIDQAIPHNRVKVDADNKGLLLTGAVSTPSEAAEAMNIAKQFVTAPTDLVNQMTISAPLQVTLKVRIAQMSRGVVRKLGINWAALAQFGQIGRIGSQISYSSTSTGVVPPASCPNCPGVGVLGVIDALAQDNLAQILAEPNLTVMSGQTASFQVGGEYPIPVENGTTGQVSVTYKDFGVLLSFLPTVLSNGRINLHVAPEVSNLDSANSIQFSNGGLSISIPGLDVRKAETTVELGSGESLAIAGLLQQNTTDNGSGIPGAGDIPGIGALFRDSQFSRTETELVIIVTPYIVRPVDNPSELHLPTDNYTPPTDLERLLLMRQVADHEPPVPVRIPGAAGFMVQ